MVTIHNNDADLVKKYIGGDEKCLNILIERHQSKIFGFIYHKVLDYDVANDLFQDTFIKVINTLKKGKYNEEGKFLPWVLTIAHNMMMDYYRVHSRMKKKEVDKEVDLFKNLTATDLSYEDEIVKAEMVSKIEKLINQLPKEQQEVIKMRIYMNLSFKEIAEQTDVSINTALGRMRYAVLGLKKLIKEHEIVSDFKY